MISKFASSSPVLNKAIALSVAAMLAMNLFVLVQQLEPTPALAAATSAAATQQA